MLQRLCAFRVTGTGFYVSGHGVRKYSGGPKVFLKKVFKQIFCRQNEEIIIYRITKIII